MKAKPKNDGFFTDNEWWKKHWKGMPEYNQEDLTPFKTVYVHFTCQEDVDAFAKLVAQNIHKTTKSIWYPKNRREGSTKLIYVDEENES